MLVDDFETAFALIVTARTPDEVFGVVDDAEAKTTFRHLARLTHPDSCKSTYKDRAEDAFRRLVEMWNRRSGNVDEIHIMTKQNSYHVQGEEYRGDKCTLFSARAVGVDGAEEVLLKIPRSPSNSDLLEREAQALTTLNAEVEELHQAYFPTLYESFRHRETGAGADRTANALVKVEGLYSLADVQRAYPGGLDPRDAAWMWRRLLVALGAAHLAGVVHGAVLPEHVLIHPAEHGLLLVDWGYSVQTPGDRVPAIMERYRSWYPQEVLQKEEPTSGTDIYLASKTISSLMGARTPRAMQAFLRGGTLPAEAMRPHDAWQLLQELDELLENLYGPRRFRPFEMPD